MACFDQLLGECIEPVEVIRCKVKIRFALELPAIAKPFYRFDDGIDVFLFFFGRVGVIKAHVTGATKALGQTEVQTDRFGMAKVQVTVGFGREAGTNCRRIQCASLLLNCGARIARPVTCGIFALCQGLFDHLHQKVRGGRQFFSVVRSRRFCVAHVGVTRIKILKVILPHSTLCGR